MASAASQTAWLPPRGTHNITIGSSIRRSLSKHNDNGGEHHDAQQPSRMDFVAMRYNLKPPAVANAAGSLVPSGSYSNKDSFQLDLNAETGERHSFTARAETKKEVDCILFYDPATGTLVLERLDSLLALTHQRSPSSSLQNNNHSTNNNNGLPLNRTSPPTPLAPAATTTAATALHFPPTPPSTSPPEYTALPESIRPTRVVPKPARIRQNHNTKPGAEKEPRSQPTNIGTLNAYANSDASSPALSTTRPQGKARPQLAKRITASDFTSDPDEEVLAFGGAFDSNESQQDTKQDDMDMDDAAMPASNNALRLSDIPSRRAKRKFSDEEPDEEVLEFGRPAQEIKRAKTASQSPASIAHTPAATSDYAAASPPNARPGVVSYQSVPLRSSAAYGTKLVHGSSPLASAMVLSSGSSDEDSDDDDDFEEVMPGVLPAAAGDGDGEEDDFLAAAFNNDDDAPGAQDGAVSDHSDDSSDESDYDER